MRALSLGLLAMLAGCGGPATLGTDAGAADTGAPAVDLGALPADTWSYVPVPGAVCGNGTPAAIGVNPHPGASQLLVVIAGGGACWDHDTCFVVDSAVHVHEDYSRSIFTSEIEALGSSGLDDRGAPTNAFRAFHLVYVPYCTGDLHGGDAVQAYEGREVHHRGARNVGLYLDAMRAAWPSLAQTFVLGFSAGGFGAQLNWGRFADAWPGDALAILADGSPMLQPTGDRYATWRSAWNMTTPSDCAECSTRFAAYDAYYDAQRPDTRFGLITTRGDAVIGTYFAITDMPTTVDAFLTDELDGASTTRYFVADGTEHVLLDDVPAPSAVDGTPLGTWVAGFLANDASAWHSTR